MISETKGAEAQETVIGRDSVDYLLQDGTRLQLELWFPAIAPLSALKQHKDYSFSVSLKKNLVDISGMPSMTISTKETSNGLRDVVAKPGSFPVVIFSHGFTSFSRQNSRQLEALALAGYIVIAPSHPGDSLTTEYSDGTIVEIDRSQDALELTSSKANKSKLKDEIAKIAVESNQLRRKKSIEQYLLDLPQFVDGTIYRHYVTSAQRRRGHLVQLVSQLIAKDPQAQDTALADADLTRIALYGHSLGGVVSVLATEELNREESRVKAVVNLDAVQFVLPDENSINLSTPTCFIMGGSTKMGKTKISNLYLNSPWAQANKDVCEINVTKAAHNNFTDLTYVTPLKWFGQLGPIKNKAFGDWINGFLIAYFDSKLLGKHYSYPIWPSAELVGTI